MAKKKKRSEDDGPPAIGEWIVTFSDCMTLLLCFFVLLLTFSSFDEEALKRIAQTTGAKYYRAVDTESLQEAYAEINELEVTEIELGDYFEHKDGFMPYAVAGTLAILASVFSRRRWYETIP